VVIKNLPFLLSDTVGLSGNRHNGDSFKYRWGCGWCFMWDICILEGEMIKPVIIMKFQ
jgi:hypothetical protein